MAKPKLNQILAVVAGKKAKATSTLTEAYHAFKKPELFAGMARAYTPRNEEDEAKPPEKKLPQESAKTLCANVKAAVADMFDYVACQDWANTTAKADIVVDGKTLLADVPVTYLLFLEKQLKDLATFAGSLPLRDGAEDWTFQNETGLFVTALSRRNVTAKVQEPIVLYDATEKHPAQTQLITRDVVVGHWDERRSSTAVTKTEQDAMLSRIQKLLEAVLTAREAANNSDADKRAVGGPLMEYVFAGIV